MASMNARSSALRAAGVALLAVAGGALSVQGARVFCRFVSASSTRIQYQDGYAEARTPPPNLRSEIVSAGPQSRQYSRFL